MPAGTALAGELVAIDDDGTPDFNLLQNFRTGARQIQYYVFELLCLKNRDTTKLPLAERRGLLKSLSSIDQRIKIIDYIEAEPAELLRAVHEQRLEGVVGTDRQTARQSNQRSCTSAISRGAPAVFLLSRRFRPPHTRWRSSSRGVRSISGARGPGLLIYHWQMRLKKVFDLAGVSNDEGNAIPHRFRDYARSGVATRRHAD